MLPRPTTVSAARSNWRRTGRRRWPKVASHCIRERCRNIAPAEVQARRNRGEPASIRLKIPPRPLSFHDLVHRGSGIFPPGDRRPHPAALRRHPGVQLCCSGGRRADGHHPRRPGRRPPVQHAAPGGGLPGAGLGAAAVCPPVHHSGQRPHPVEQAARRHFRRSLSPARDPAGSADELPGAAGAGRLAKATGKSSRRRSWCKPSASTRSRRARRCSIPRS